jgi:serine/threonine-protein kinase
VAKEFSPGARVDRYVVLHHVATGGMGSVWEAELAGKHGFAKRVALKAIRAELAGEPRFKEMFLEEARLSSRLSHANVAQVLDVGDHDGTMYIVFEWVDGRSLETICRDAASAKQPVSIELALRVLADVCAGLHAVHELRSDEGEPLHVVHRDVTPNNVLVSRDGFAKVIDFGLAKAKDRAITATKSGVVKGTPQFMAPEQALGHPVDRRADVFSAGAVLFRVLAGNSPFPDREALAAFVLHKRVPDLPDEVPEAVRALVQKAMSCDVDGRYATAAEMRLALERATHRDLATVSLLLPPVAPESPVERLVPSVTVVEGAAPLALAATEHAAATPATRTVVRSSRRLLLALVVAAAVVAAALAVALRS